MRMKTREKKNRVNYIQKLTSRDIASVSKFMCWGSDRNRCYDNGMIVE